MWRGVAGIGIHDGGELRAGRIGEIATHDISGERADGDAVAGQIDQIGVGRVGGDGGVGEALSAGMDRRHVHCCPVATLVGRTEHTRQNP